MAKHKRIFFLLIATVSLFSGCSGDGDTAVLIGIVDLTADRSLVTVNQTLTVPTPTPLGGTTPVLGGVSPALAGVTPAIGGSTPVNTPAAPALGSATVSGTPTVEVNLLTVFSAVFSASIDGFFSASPTCSLVGAYTGFSCQLPAFTLSSTDLRGKQGIRVRINEAGATGTSNTIPVRSFSVAQVSNTSGSQFVDDKFDGFMEFDGNHYFLARNANSRNKWFRLTSSGISQFTDTRSDQALDDNDLMDVQAPVQAGSKLYFVSRNTQGFYKLFTWTGSSLLQVTNHASDNGVHDGFGKMAALGSDLIYVAENINGQTKIFKTDGVAVTQVSDTTGDDNQSDIPLPAIPPSLVTIGDYVYFVARNTNSVAKIFRTDGTVVEQITNTIGDQLVTDNPDLLMAYDGALYFVAEKSAGVFKLYKAVGTTVSQVSNTRGNQSNSDNPGLLTECNGRLFFRSVNQNAVPKLFETDGVTVTQVSDSVGNQSATDSITLVKCAGETLAFYGRNASGGRKLYFTDGSTTTPISNTRQNPAFSDNVADVIQYGDSIYFVANNSAGKSKFYAYRDGQVYRMTDINPGENDSDAFVGGASGGGKFLTVFNNLLYFTAVVDGDTGAVSKLFTLCDPNLECE